MFFLLRKLFQAAMLLAGVALISFILFQYLGDPVANMLPESATEVERMQLRASLGLNDPVAVSVPRVIFPVYFTVISAFHITTVSVFQLIMERLPATLELVFVAVIISLAVGFPLGVWVAITRNKLLREGVQILSLIGVSLPWFLIGIMLIIVFSVWLGWFPSSGRGETVKIGFWSTGLLTASGWRSIVLPALSLALSMITIITCVWYEQKCWK